MTRAAYRPLTRHRQLKENSAGMISLWTAHLATDRAPEEPRLHVGRSPVNLCPRQQLSEQESASLVCWRSLGVFEGWRTTECFVVQPGRGPDDARRRTDSFRCRCVECRAFIFMHTDWMDFTKLRHLARIHHERDRACVRLLRWIYQHSKGSLCAWHQRAQGD